MTATDKTAALEDTRLPLTSADINAERVAALRDLFPEAFSEGQLDVDKLRLALGEATAEGPERYGLSWAGKAEAMRAVQIPSVGTLTPVPEESVNFDSSENLFIEGDNLEVLKLLQKSYHGKVKMIYIDPPYNTGNDFIYPDNFREGLQDYLRYSGQTDADGFRVSTTTDTDGRIHSKWLSMMYPRLFLARQLLRDDGVIFVSIDDNEANNLFHLMNEIFGEENFVAQFVWAAGRKNDSKLVSVSHEYIVCYVRNKELLASRGVQWRQRKKGLDDIYAAYGRLRRLHGGDNAAVTAGLKDWYAALPVAHPARQHSHYSVVDDRGVYFPDNISWPGGGGPTYEVLHPITRRPCAVPSRGWMFGSPERMEEVIADDRVHFGPDEANVPCIKSYLKDREYQVPYSVFYQDGRAATKRLRTLMGGDVFDHPKDELVMQELVETVTGNDDIILDFFAGSSTTAHGVLTQNTADSGQRQFVMVQLPEEIDQRSIAFRSGYSTIADIGKERIRRVIAKLEAEPSATNSTADLGFKVFKLTSSNFRLWDGRQTPRDATGLAEQLRLHTEHVLPGRTRADVLYELLLKAGLPLTAKVVEIEAAGVRAYSIADGLLLICLEDMLTAEQLRALLALGPQRVLCYDHAFGGNDQLKTNIVLEMRDRGVEFRTV